MTGTLVIILHNQASILEGIAQLIEHRKEAAIELREKADMIREIARELDE